MKWNAIIATLLLATLLVTPVAATSHYSGYRALDNDGFIRINTGHADFVGECREDISGENYALSMYSRVLDVVITPEEIEANCQEPDGVDKIVALVDEATAGKDLSAACSEMTEAVDRCESAADRCDELKQGTGSGFQFSCPPDEAKMIEACKERLAKPIDNCEGEYAKHADRIAQYCSGGYNPLNVGAEAQLGEERGRYSGEYSSQDAQAQCTRYGGNWQNGNCVFATDRPLHDVSSGECPPADESIRQYCQGTVAERTFDVGGHSCRMLICESQLVGQYPTSGQYPNATYPSGQYNATVGSSSQPAGCPIVTMPTCATGEYAQASSFDSNRCPTAYSCVSSAGGGNYSTTGTGGGNYSTTAGTGGTTGNYSQPTTTTTTTTCSPAPTCSSGQHLVQTGTDSSGCSTYTCQADSTTTGGTGDTSGSGAYTPPSGGGSYTPPSGTHTQTGSRITGLQVAAGLATSTTPPYPAGTGQQGDFCTRESFIHQCRGAVLDASLSLSSSADEICATKVKYMLPQFKQFCAEGGRANAFGQCKAFASKNCGCMKSKLANCKAFATRAKFLELVRRGAETECRKYTGVSTEMTGAINDLESVTADLPVEDRVVADQAVSTYTFTAAELEEYRNRIAEEERADALARVKVLLGLQAGQIEEQIATLQDKRASILESIAAIQAVCEKLSGDTQSECQAAIAPLQAEADSLGVQIHALESDKNGLLGAIARIFTGG